ncbi:MAG: hypothetical protein KOO62_05570 [candidate division Zixibacteria bacterium]|nr:hypothetical protein [candidate division Zixibacteria bacterium]
MNLSRFRFLHPGVLAIAIGLMVLVSASTGSAQQAVTGTADGTVLSAIVLAAGTNLEFGDIFPGVPKTVARTATGGDTTAAIFTITGEAGAGVTAQFMLPEYLSSSAGAQMNITFSSTDMAIDTTNSKTPLTVVVGDGWVDEDPRSFPAALVIGGTEGPTVITSVFLGGKVIPSMYQPSGTYSGDIVLSVSYNGN